MFRVVLPPIIRSAYNCIYSIWYLSHCYCYLIVENLDQVWLYCGWRTPPIAHSNQTQAPKEMTAMYNFRTGICWASSCLVLSLKIITLLQMRWEQIISEFPIALYNINSFFKKEYIFQLLQTRTFNNCHSSKISKNTQHLCYQIAKSF
jgi:hypothetical protein